MFRDFVSLCGVSHIVAFVAAERQRSEQCQHDWAERKSGGSMVHVGPALCYARTKSDKIH